MRKTILVFLLAGVFLFGGNFIVKAQTVDDTQARIQALLEQIKNLQAQVQTLQAQFGASSLIREPQPIPPPGGLNVPRACELPQAVAVGLKEPRVRILQQYLSLDPAVYPEGFVTGYYGPLTDAAFKKFQEKYGLPVTGALDAATKAKLEERISANISRIPECGIVSFPTALGTESTFPVIVGGGDESGSPPRIDSLSPPVSAIPAYQLQIIGKSFTPTDNTVKFNNLTVAVTRSYNDGTLINIVIPPQTPLDTYQVRVSNARGVSNPMRFIVRAPTLTISSVTPSQALPGDTLTIKGGPFTTSTNNWIELKDAITGYSEGSLASPLLSPDGTTLVTQIPSFEFLSKPRPGNYRVYVVNGVGEGRQGITLEPSVTILPYWPVATSLSPNSGPPGTPVTITGVFFTTSSNNWIEMINSAGQSVRGMVSPVVSPDGTTLQTSVYTGSFAPPPGTYKIRITNILNNVLGLPDLTNAPTFTVTSPTTTAPITVLYPNGGETLRQGEQVAIRWVTIPSGEPAVVGLNLAKDNTGGFPVGIGNVPNTGSYAWTVPDTYSGSGFRIRAYGNGVDDSDAPFSIVSATSTASTVTVLAPNGGEQLQIGSSYTISWKAGGTLPWGNNVVYLALEKPGDPLFVPGATGVLLGAGSLPTTGSYTWKVGDYVSTAGVVTAPAGSQYRIVVVLYSFTTNQVLARDTSDAYFSLVSAPTTAPTITSISPSSGPPATSVTLVGSGFTNSTRNSIYMRSGGSSTLVATPFSPDGKWLSFLVPAVIVPATYEVFVQNANGTSNAVNFVVPVPPVITSISPTSGSVGTSVVLTGTGFSSYRNVIRFTTRDTLNFGTAAIEAISPDGRTLQFLVPSLTTQMSSSGPIQASTTPGVYYVDMFNSNGTSNRVEFTVTTGTTISSITPTSGAVGSSVTIYGSGFTTGSTNTVNFGPTYLFVASSDGAALSFAVPQVADGTYTVYVSNVNGTSKSVTFTVATPTSGSGGGGGGDGFIRLQLETPTLKSLLLAQVSAMTKIMEEILSLLQSLQ